MSPAEPAAAGNEDDNPQTAALRAQIEPIVKVELSFANRACGWTKDERVAAAGAAKVWIRDFARAHLRDNGLRNRLMIVRGNGAIVGPNQQSDVEKELVAALVKQMTDAQRTAYEAERAKRAELRRDASIENIVSLLDDRLDLTPEQRGLVSQSLREKWSDDWAPSLEMFVHLPDYVPAVPDGLIEPHLTPQQRVLWQGVQKISARGIIFGGGMFGDAVPPIDDIEL